MMYSHCTFSGAHVGLDHSTFIQCAFQNVTFVYYGAGPYKLANCSMTGQMGLEFTGEADKTLKRIGALYRESAEKATLVNTLFDRIRRRLDPTAALAQLDPRQLRSSGAVLTARFLSDICAWGAGPHAMVETIFADLKAGDYGERAA